MYALTHAYARFCIHPDTQNTPNECLYLVQLLILDHDIFPVGYSRVPIDVDTGVRVMV
jgi:hypothetical protein